MIELQTTKEERKQWRYHAKIEEGADEHNRKIWTLLNDLETLLAKLETSCHECGAPCTDADLVGNQTELRFPKYWCNRCFNLHMTENELTRAKKKIAELMKQVHLFNPHSENQDNIDLCPTFYDGCHCTVETLEHNIKRADEAEAKIKKQDEDFEFVVKENTVLREAAARVRIENVELRKDLARVKSRLDVAYDYQRGDYWLWQNDEEDHLESLTCPILISADHMREIFSKLEQVQKSRNKILTGYMSFLLDNLLEFKTDFPDLWEVFYAEHAPVFETLRKQLEPKDA